MSGSSMLRAVRIGVLVGVAAGAVMAVWSMVAMWVTGSGFWIPLNLVAACIAAVAVADDEPVTRGRHAALSGPRPDSAPGSLFQPHHRRLG